MAVAQSIHFFSKRHILDRPIEHQTSSTGSARMSGPQNERFIEPLAKVSYPSATFNYLSSRTKVQYRRCGGVGRDGVGVNNKGPVFIGPLQACRTVEVEGSLTEVYCYEGCVTREHSEAATQADMSEAATQADMSEAATYFAWS
ncbi:unnamed protein product [Boreogadus saida]